MSEEKLSNFLRNGKNWSRLKTSVPGVFVLKLPPYKSASTRLAVELNPTDDFEKPKKRRGLILRTTNELEEYKQLFQYEKLSKLLEMLDQVNPKKEKTKSEKEKEEIIYL